MSFFTALGNYLGGRAQARQNQAQNDLYREQNKIASDDAAERKRIDDAQLQQQETQIQQQQRDRQFESGLQLPKGYAQLTPEQKQAYLYQRLNNAQRAGDQQVVADTQKQIDQLSLDAERNASTQYTMQGRLPLAQAQTQWWQKRHQEAEDAMRLRFQAADAATRARMAAAQMSANTRLQAMNMSNDERSYIATMSAINAANRMDSTQAFQEAMRQYGAANSEWQQQEKQYQLGIGTDPGAAPALQQYVPQMMPAVPSVTTVQIMLPDGTTRTAPVVVPRGGNPQSPGPSAAVQQTVTQIREALHHGQSGAKIVQQLQHMVDGKQLSPQDQETILRQVFGQPGPVR